MLFLLHVRAQSQSLRSTIYFNQSVTFSSTPAGAGSTLCAADDDSHIAMHFLTL